MPSAAALRLEIERTLERRFPAALTPVPRTIREGYATGIGEVDELLNGGLPVGAISELTGPESSGRTSLALAFVAQRTAEARPCAWVDVDDALDPESAAANGVQLRQLLWVRCKGREKETKGPRERGNKGAREQGIEGAREREANARRSGGRVNPSSTQPDSTRPDSTRPNWAWRDWTRLDWTRLDQALRATDLLLQAGGFAAIVLDLGSTAPEQANRIPAATWFRYRQAAERTRCCLVVIGQRPYARSAAEMVLQCEPARAAVAGETVLRGFGFAVRRGRERFAPVEIGTRKPPKATWQANAAWDVERKQANSSHSNCGSPVSDHPNDEDLSLRIPASRPGAPAAAWDAEKVRA
jgi:recombination protein RecA